MGDSECAACGLTRPEENSVVLPSVMPVPASLKDEGKEHKKRRPFPWIMLALSLLISGYLYCCLLTAHEGNSKLAENLRREDLRTEQLSDQMADTRAKLQDTSTSYSALVGKIKALDNSTPGYGDYYFRTDKGVLYMKKGQTEKLALTTNLYKTFTISYTAEGQFCDSKF